MWEGVVIPQQRPCWRANLVQKWELEHSMGFDSGRFSGSHGNGGDGSLMGLCGPGRALAQVHPRLPDPRITHTSQLLHLPITLIITLRWLEHNHQIESKKAIPKERRRQRESNVPSLPPAFQVPLQPVVKNPFRRNSKMAGYGVWV